MSHAFLGRISLRYDELSTMFIEWTKQCSQMWVYEHEADDKVSRTHCHILVIGSERDAEGLKKLSSWIKCNIPKGNSGSSFKKYNKIHDFEHNGWFISLTYASKGCLQPKLAHGENADAIANASFAHWEDRESANANATTIAANANANANANVCKPKRITQYQIARLAQSAYMTEHTEQFMASEGCMQVKKLVKIIVRLLKDNHMLAHKRIVAQIVSDIQADLNPDAFLRQVLSLV